MMSGATTESMIGNNRTMPNIKQEVDNPTTPTQNYQVCSPTTTLQHQEVLKLLRELDRSRLNPRGECDRVFCHYHINASAINNQEYILLKHFITYIKLLSQESFFRNFSLFMFYIYIKYFPEI